MNIFSVFEQKKSFPTVEFYNLSVIQSQDPDRIYTNMDLQCCFYNNFGPCYGSGSGIRCFF